MRQFSFLSIVCGIITFVLPETDVYAVSDLDTPNSVIITQANAPQISQDSSGYLLGNMMGLRPWLYTRGLSFNLNETSEIWGNPSGGQRHGISYNGMTTASLSVDMNTFAGIQDGVFNVSATQVHGEQFSKRYLANFAPISGTEWNRTIRLWELWYDQGFFNNKLSIRLGKLDLAAEFDISDYASTLINADWGWMSSTGSSLWGGGPAKPLSSPAARVHYQFSDKLAVLFAIANDNGVGLYDHDEDPSTRNRSGTNWNFGNNALFVGELQYHNNELDDDGVSVGLPAVYRLGGFFDNGKFPDPYYNTDHQPSGSGGNGDHLMRRGNWNIYSVIDQTLWQANSGVRAFQSFVRANYGPDSRNIVSFDLGVGAAIIAPFSMRPKDVFSFGWAMSRASDHQRWLSEYDRKYDGKTPVQKTENRLEIAYLTQVTPWLQLEPDFQYIFNPSGGVLNYRGTHRVYDELVLGVRASINL